MPFQVSRTDTGQFVLMEPTTDTVVIDDDLAVGFAKLERIVADQPARPAVAAQAASAFAFRGGPRYTPVLLAVVLPFAWLAVLYLALANLLSEHALDRGSARETQTKIEALERELQALRSEIAGAPRTPKSKPKPQPGPKGRSPEATKTAAADGKAPGGSAPGGSAPGGSAPGGSAPADGAPADGAPTKPAEDPIR